MTIVIDISEKAYNALTHTEFDANLVVDEMRKAIVNGTPLPEQQPNYLKKRDGNYAHYNVEWLLKNWQMELDILSDGKIKPCEDCISRADVLALAEKGTLVSNGNYKSVCKAINDLPSVTPKAEWIPVSERLPEEDGMYLVSEDYQ